MTPGTDLKAAALPEIPAGHRWSVERNKYKEVIIYLEEKAMIRKKWWKPLEEGWRTVSARQVDPYKETVRQAVERVAGEIVAKKKKELQRLMEEEAILGIYESNQNKALYH